MRVRKQGMFFLLIILSSFLVFLASAPASARTMEDLFTARDWKGVDQLLAEKGDSLSPREQSMAANALWFRSRWADALVLLKKSAPHWPSAVRPYGTLMTILALERTGEKDGARKTAAEFLSSAPKDIGYYVAYALYRLTDEKDIEGRKKYLRKMYSLAENTSQQSTALSFLLKLPGDKTAYALNLLNIHPRNSAALRELESLKKPWKADVSFAVGYAAYLRGQYSKAVPLLKAVPLDSRNGRKARYYRAYSLYSLKKYGQALELWSYLARNGTSYAESSIRRISILADRAQKDRALRVLREVARDRKESAVKARAYYSLSTHASGKEQREYEEKVIALAPDSSYTVRILWNRGWARWKNNDIAGAIREWERSVSPAMDSSWRPRVLYWIAKGYGRLNVPEKREAAIQSIRKHYPLSIYAFLSGGEKLDIVPAVPPAFASGTPSELEKWGFIIYARRTLAAGGNTKSLFKAALLAEWSEDHIAAYSAARRLTSEISRGPSFFRKGLEFIYPRPFLKEVRSAAERFNIEENLVWAIMRQESAFDQNATSWVGASGLMQLMPGTAKAEAKALKMKKYNIYDPGDNIILGTSHIARLLKSFGSTELAVAAYNAGGGNARRWLAGRKNPPPLDEWIEMVRFEETNGYVQKVMANLHVYRELYGTPGKNEGGPSSAGTISEDEDIPIREDEPDPEEGNDDAPFIPDDGGK